MKRQILVSDDTYFLIGLMVHSVLVDHSAEHGVLTKAEALGMKRRALEKIDRLLADPKKYHKLVDELMIQVPPPFVRDRGIQW